MNFFFCILHMAAWRGFFFFFSRPRDEMETCKNCIKRDNNLIVSQHNKEKKLHRHELS